MGDVLKPLPPLPQVMKGGGHPGIEGELGSSSSREGNNKLPLPTLVITSFILNIALFLCCVLVAFFRCLHCRRSRYSPPEAREHVGEPFPVGALPAGLHASVLRQIPIYTYRGNNIEGEEEEGGGGEEERGMVGVNSECVVCLREFRHGNTLRILPACGHAFHLGCIDRWLGAHATCPLCRSQVMRSSEPVVEDEGSLNGNDDDDDDNDNNRNNGDTDIDTNSTNSNNYNNNEAVSEGTSSADGNGGREIIIAKMGGNLHRSLSDGEISMHGRHNHVIIITIAHLAMPSSSSSSSSSIGQNRSSSLERTLSS